MYDVAISGYYGFRNSGDEALLKSIISDLRRLIPDIKIVVFSNDPEFTKAEHCVDSVNRMSFFEVRRVLNRTKLLISGGGSLIQDATSTKSLMYYLGLIRLAKRCGAKVMIYANGVGPVSGKLNRAAAKNTLNKTDYITLRENDSLGELKAMGVNVPKTEVTADPALGLIPDASGRDEAKRLFGEKTPIAFSVREWKTLGANGKNEIADCIKRLKSVGFAPFMLPMQYSKDNKICSEIAEAAGVSVLRDEYGVGQILGILSACPAVVGMRLHALIYALAAESSPVGIVYDPKVRGFMNYAGLSEMKDVSEITADGLFGMIMSAISKKPLADISEMRKLAFRNAQIAAKLLK